MIGFLAQVVVVGRNDDFEGWTQILVFVIIAVGYAISGILKAASKKTEQTEGQEGPQRCLARPVGPTARRQFRVTPQPQRPSVLRQGLRPDEKVAQPEPVLQKLAEAEKALQIREIQTQFKPDLAITTPQMETKIPELTEFTGETIKGLEFSMAGITKVEEKAGVGFPATLWLDIDDPDEIRQAILHYEILGKPLSLRDPSE